MILAEAGRSVSCRAIQAGIRLGVASSGRRPAARALNANRIQLFFVAFFEDFLVFFACFFAECFLDFAALAADVALLYATAGDGAAKLGTTAMKSSATNEMSSFFMKESPSFMN